jgi:hypothetical protein
VSSRDGLWSGYEAAITGQQRPGCIVGLPNGQGERLESVLQLLVGADRQVGLLGSHADQRDAQLVAQIPQHVEEFVAGVGSAGQQVVQLVDHQRAHADPFE